MNCLITSGLLKRNDIKDLNKLQEFTKLLKSYDVVLVDEVEYTINPSGEFLYERLSGASYFYGFSGTADKSNGNMISFINGLSDIVINNKDLVKWFGPSLVYRMPLTIDIDCIDVKTSAFDNIKFDEALDEKNENLYMKIMNTIWTTPQVCNLIKKIIRKYPKTFIPINNLTSILSEWINNYFIGEFKILLVCGEGYIYYDLSGNKTKLTLQEACDKISSGEVDVIPSTAAGYRALDFPKLENILLIQGKLAGVVLQAVGRVARNSHMNIITLSTKNSKPIPVFTKGTKERYNMIHEYYKYCKIIDSVILEERL